MLAIGAVVMVQLENRDKGDEDDSRWRYDDGFYWAAVTMTTVGYGDLCPSTDASKLFACAFIILSLWLIASAIGFTASIPFEIRRIRNVATVLRQFGENLQAEELTKLAFSTKVQMLRT